MRILILNYEYPPIGGGGGTYTQQLAGQLAVDHDVVVLTARWGDLPREETQGRLTIRRVPARRKRADRSTPLEMLAYMLSAMWHGWRLTGRWKPDVTLAAFGIPGGPVGYWLKLLRRIPYVVILLGGDVPGAQPYDADSYHRRLLWLTRFVWRRAAAVVANSGGLATLAQQTTPELDIKVIPNGLDLDVFTPRPAALPANDRVRILFVGRLVQQKAPGVLLEAAARLKAMLGSSFVIDIIGDGDLRPALEAQAAALDVGDVVAFCGWAERDALPGAYHRADVFCLPSRDEGMPFVMVMALASGLPAVGTDIRGTRDLIHDGETGYLVPVEDADALAEALAKLIKDEAARQRMGAAARALAERDYNSATMAARFETLIHSLPRRS